MTFHNAQCIETVTAKLWDLRSAEKCSVQQGRKIGTTQFLKNSININISLLLIGTRDLGRKKFLLPGGWGRGKGEEGKEGVYSMNCSHLLTTKTIKC